MPGDPFKKVLPGQKLNLPAEAFNGFVDAANFVRGRKHNIDTETESTVRQTGIVKIRNASGVTLPRFGVVGLVAPIIMPNENLREFQNQPTFEGIGPSAAGRFGVLLEPLAVGAIGRGVVAGVVAVRMRVDPARIYEWADIEPGDPLALRNLPAGSARVLWVEELGASSRWALVRIEPSERQEHVLILSNIPDSEGYLPGVVQRYDVATGSWNSLYPCKVLDINR